MVLRALTFVASCEIVALQTYNWQVVMPRKPWSDAMENRDVDSVGMESQPKVGVDAEVRQRRRFLRVGLGVAPIAATFVSPSVLGCASYSPSVHASAGSRAITTTPHGGCKSPSQWVPSTNPPAWPTGCSKNNLLNTVFPTCPSAQGSKTCGWILSTANTTYLTEKICLNAYLNAQAGCLTSVNVTGATVKSMHQNGVMLNSWPVPGTGKLWDKTACVNYLTTTMPSTT